MDGQLIWLGGHFEKAAFSRGPSFLMQCFSTVFGSCPPLVFSHNLRHPSCCFFNTYDIITIMITTNGISRKIQRITTKCINTTKMLFLTFNFKRQILMRRLTLQQYDQLRNLWLSVGQCCVAVGCIAMNY